MWSYFPSNCCSVCYTNDLIGFTKKETDDETHRELNITKSALNKGTFDQSTKEIIYQTIQHNFLPLLENIKSVSWKEGVMKGSFISKMGEVPFEEVL